MNTAARAAYVLMMTFLVVVLTLVSASNAATPVASCATSPDSDLQLCNQACCGTLTCNCSFATSGRHRGVLCQYDQCVAAALVAHGCTQDPLYLNTYTAATVNTSSCTSLLSASGCPSSSAWASAERCSASISCSSNVSTLCTATCYAQTLLCYAGALCGVGVSTPAVNYCQWLLGDVAGVTANGPLGSCLPVLNGSTIAHHQLCIQSVELSGSLQSAAASNDGLTIAVILLSITTGVLLIAIIAMVVFVTLPTYLRRQRRIVDSSAVGDASSNSTGMMATRRPQGGGASSPPNQNPQQRYRRPNNNNNNNSSNSSNCVEDDTPGDRPARSSSPKLLQQQRQVSPPTAGNQFHHSGGAVRDSGEMHASANRRSSIAWVEQHASSTSFSTHQSLLINRIGLQEELAKTIVRLIKVGKWQRGRLIGRGGSGAVHCCLLGNGSFVAHKELLLPTLGKAEAMQLSQELAIISRLNHRHCVRYYHAEVRVEQKQVGFWMEFVAGGALSSLVKSLADPLAENVGKSYIRQMLHGLAYLHSHGIVHRDVKADNVLVDSDGIVKLADFGSSKIMRGGSLVGSSANGLLGGIPNASYTDTMVGTPFWMAPEVVTLSGDPTAAGGSEKEGYNNRADVWSLGITACEILSQGQVPWPSFSTYWDVLVHISQKDPTIPDHVSPLCKEFLKACLVRDPKKRPSARELLAHPWLDDSESGVAGHNTSFEVQETNQDFKASFGFRECLRTLGELQRLEEMEDRDDEDDDEEDDDRGEDTNNATQRQRSAVMGAPSLHSTIGSTTGIVAEVMSDEADDDGHVPPDSVSVTPMEYPPRPVTDHLPNDARGDDDEDTEEISVQRHSISPQQLHDDDHTHGNDDDLMGDPFEAARRGGGHAMPPGPADEDPSYTFNINISSQGLGGSSDIVAVATSDEMTAPR